MMNILKRLAVFLPLFFIHSPMSHADLVLNHNDLTKHWDGPIDPQGHDFFNLFPNDLLHPEPATEDYYGLNQIGPLPRRLPPDHILQNRTVALCAYCALSQAQFGKTEIEWAFWVLEDKNGDLSCQGWETNGTMKRKVSTKSIPTNAIAMFHTHPADSAKINDQDRQMAYTIEEKYGFGIIFYILAGDLIGYIDPVNKTESRNYRDWLKNSSWHSSFSKEEKTNACSDSKI